MNELMTELTRSLPLIPLPVFECGVLLLLGGILKQLMIICRTLKRVREDVVNGS